ncbi:MAG: FAD-dependent oxidoreductase [Myxococcales bacterium]|nr:FAD-dependent oxidoreductase [Myxococcales bacterium]MDD9967733.1 FAD-dependent oxidoreductase [Myxococcales bacterium]
MRWSRREVLSLILGAPLATRLLACDRPSQRETPREIEGRLLGQDHRAGHRLRSSPPGDDIFARAPVQTTEVVIVGGGPAGLAAAYQLRRNGQRGMRLLELEAELGGTSRDHRGPSEALANTRAPHAFPWGAHYITQPLDHNRPLQSLLSDMGVLESDGRAVREQYLVRDPKERLFYRGFFYEGLYPAIGATQEDRRQWQRFGAKMQALARMRDGQGRPAFAIPMRYGSDDPTITELDRISAATWLTKHGFTSERLRFCVDYACRDDYGLTLHDTSAWAMVLYYAARIDPATGRGTQVITWPQGNGALVAFLRTSLAADQVRSHSLVVDVVPKPEGTGVSVHAIDTRSGKPMRVDARCAIVATPAFVTQRIVRPIRERTAGDADRGRQVDYGAWMVANLHLSERPQERGFEQAWDTVLHDSPSLGYVNATHQRGRSFGPTVWTYYLPMTDRDARAGRRRLFEPDYSHFRDAILLDLRRAHRDLPQKLARLDVFRWGHGMIQPRVGTVWSPTRRTTSQPLGPIHFAHTDLSGLALFEEAFEHGVRAANEVTAVLRGSNG